MESRSSIAPFLALLLMVSSLLSLGCGSRCLFCAHNGAQGTVLKRPALRRAQGQPGGRMVAPASV